MAYELLIMLLEDYNVNLLSTKIYWEKPEEKEEYLPNNVILFSIMSLLSNFPVRNELNLS